MGLFHPQVQNNIANGIFTDTFRDSNSLGGLALAQLMPAISLQWTQSDNNLFYASYAEGFKSGGFNAVDDQLPDFAQNPLPPFTIPGSGFEYDDETAQSFETGRQLITCD